MRKTTQSMYQPGKQPKANAKLGSMIQGVGLSKSIVGSKKVEGHDIREPSKSPFELTISNLKSKPQQKVVEEEYIAGLQEEIKYLEYELKLLKDKEILEREGVNQLDNFLKDEIPINENILAMKNKYNSTKSKLEQQFKLLSGKNVQAADLLKTQHNQITLLHQIIDAHRKEKNHRRNQFKTKLEELIRQTTLTRQEYSSTSEQIKLQQEQIKRMNETISNIQRQNEKDKVLQVRVQQQRSKKQQKFQQKFKQTKIQLIQYQQRLQQLQALEDKNPLLDPLQEQNSILRKKIMLNDKQRSSAQNLIAQIQLFLKEQSREREMERQQKTKYLSAIDECRTQIQHMDRYHQSMVREDSLRTKKLQLKEMTRDLKEKEDCNELLVDRLRSLEQDCSNLIQEKKELQDAMEGEKVREKELVRELEVMEAEVVVSRSKADGLGRVTIEILKETQPVQDQLEKCKGRIPIVEKDIEKKTTSIHYLNKQIDILKELKTLDLEQLQLISQGGSQMQNALHSFIKNWEKIQSL